MFSKAFTQSIIDHFQSTYQYEGLWGIAMNSRGEWINPAPVIADFGDIAPFLLEYDQEALVKDQFEASKKHLRDGLFHQKGYARLFLNHDWLLGLIDAYRHTEDQDYLDVAKQAAETLTQVYLIDGFLLNEPVSSRSFGAFLGESGPFNGGYIELYLELFDITKEERYLHLAIRGARAWSNSNYFRKNQLFSTVPSVRFPLINRILSLKPGMAVRLFKQNTNLLFSLANLYEVTRDPEWEKVLENWTRGFERSLYDQGRVYLILSNFGRRKTPDLKAGFSALDLLCDLHHLEISQTRLLPMIKGIADYWLNLQWSNGLWPVREGKDKNHLDANTDFAVALTKVYAITMEKKYWDAYLKARTAIPEIHQTDYGFVQSVNSMGAIVEDRITVKYQSLLLKLALLPDEPQDVFAAPDLKLLIRDR